MSAEATDTLLLGIDLGTSAVKVLAVTPRGEIRGRAARPYPVTWLAEGRAEQDPATWWQATVEAVREALARASAGSRGRVSVAAIGLAGQVNGVVLLDARGQVLRPAIIWLDRRAAAAAEEINARAGDLLAQGALGRAGPIHTAAKLLWLLRHEPGTVHQARVVLAPKDFLAYRLTGRAVTDVTDAAATLLLDLHRRSWSAALLDRLGLPAHLLPEVVESPTVTGRLAQAPAEVLGLPPGVPVVAGAGDMAAITAGTGVISPGVGCIMVGTAGQIALAMAGIPTTTADGVWAMAAPLPGAYFWHGLVMTAGHCLTWLAELIGGELDHLLAEAAEVPPGSGGLLFLPFLDGAATPHADPHARAALVGATSTHGRREVTRAVLEGVAFNFREAFEQFAGLGQRASRIRLGGGGARSPLWARVLADVLGTPMELLAEHDASALGATIIAAVATGVHRDFAAACGAMVHLQGLVAPDPQAQHAYDRVYGLYRGLYHRLRETAHGLATVAAAAPAPGGPAMARSGTE